MATVSGYSYNPQIEGGLKSGADYSATDPFVFIKVDSADEQVITAGAGEQGIGIRMNKPLSGEAVEVAIGGIAPLVLGDTVARGAKIKSDAAGKGVASTADREIVLAIALRSGVVGDIIPVLLMPFASSNA